MINELKLIGFILFIGLAGWVFHLLFPSASGGERPRSSLVDLFQIFVAGVGLCSLIFFLLAIFGYLRPAAIASALLVFLSLLIVKRRISVPYILFCLAIGFSVTVFSRLCPPYEAFLQGNDASVYLSTAGQIAESGGLFYTDPLVLEMSQNERRNLFFNRFRLDTTGVEARFPGGVRLIDVSKGTVTFGFYHMFPVWLGTAILILGQHQFLLLLTFFHILSLIAIFLLGRRFGGLLTGIALPLLFLCFYPEIYFLRMPTSEGLSQALFLSGLWIFVSGLRADGTMLRGSQLVVGMLWGSTFLCHVIALFYGSLCLVLVFAMLRPLAENLSRWRTLFVCLVTCGFLALYQQLTVQEYVYIGSFFGLGKNVTKAWEESMRWFGTFLLQQRWIGVLLLIALYALLVPLSSVLMRAVERKRGLRIFICILMIAVMMSSLFRRRFHWVDIFQHLGWLSLYTSPVVLGLLLIGAVLFLYLQSDSIPARSAFLFLPVHLISLLIFPLVVFQDQPWTIRRFVPVVFPLLFLFGVSGWRQALIRFGARANGARASSAPATKVHAISLAGKMPAFSFGNTIDFLFVIFVCAIVFVFITKSYDLLAQRLYKDVLAQTKTLDDHVPANALLLVADNYAGIHLETPLQYFLDRDVLLLPFDRQPSPGFKATVDSYLKRQRRPLFAILDPSSLTALKSQRIFRVEMRTGFNISFLYIPKVNQDSFPDPPQNNSMNLDVYRISEKGDPPEKSGIRFDDQDVTFLNFYAQERGWRWTTGASEIADFTFHTEGKETMLILSTIKGFPAGGGNPELIINGTTIATLLRSEAGEFHFQVDGKEIPEIHSLLIRSQTFVPIKSKVDRRNLGLSFVSVRFLRK